MFSRLAWPRSVRYLDRLVLESAGATHLLRVTENPEGVRTRKPLRGATVDLILQEAHLFLKQHLALKGVMVLGLKLLGLKWLVRLFELPEGRLADFQPRRKFGDLIQQMCRARGFSLATSSQAAGGLTEFTDKRSI